MILIGYRRTKTRSQAVQGMETVLRHLITHLISSLIPSLLLPPDPLRTNFLPVTACKDGIPALEAAIITHVPPLGCVALSFGYPIPSLFP